MAPKAGDPAFLLLRPSAWRDACKQMRFPPVTTCHNKNQRFRIDNDGVGYKSPSTGGPGAEKTCPKSQRDDGRHSARMQELVCLQRSAKARASSHDSAWEPEGPCWEPPITYQNPDSGSARAQLLLGEARCSRNEVISIAKILKRLHCEIITWASELGDQGFLSNIP